nr:MAG: hypothetical protein [Microvirus Sku121]
MQNWLTFNISLDPEKSLLENLDSELKDTEVMIDLFTSRHQVADSKFYEEKKEYLEKLIKEVKKID